MATYYGESKIDSMIAKAGGVDVTVAGVTVKGLVDLADEELLRGERADLVGKVVSVVLHTGALPGLVTGVTLTTGGVNYKVREILQQGDGAQSKVLCSRE